MPKYIAAGLSRSDYQHGRIVKKCFQLGETALLDCGGVKPEESETDYHRSNLPSEGCKGFGIRPTAAPIYNLNNLSRL